MTCVLASPWQPQPFSPSYGWSPLNTDCSMSTSTGSDKPHLGYLSSESESRQTSGGSGKKRASRAGTRSVTTLSAAQLERKRANDREAQRAIRQRTKDHIDGLERNLSELRAAHDANEKMVVVTQQRNRELEDENAYLRTKLGETGYPVPLPTTENHRPSDPALLSGHPASPASQASSSIGRPNSTSAPRSGLSLNTAQSIGTPHSSWQHTPTTLVSSTAGTTPTLSAPGTMNIGSTLTTWRSHESSPSIHSNSGQMTDPSQAQQNSHYAANPQHGRSQWTAPPTSYAYQDQQRNHQFEASSQHQAQYGQQPVPSYAPNAASQQTAYAAPQPPQTEFQGMAVSSPAAYQHTFAPTAQYPMAGIQVSPAPNNNEFAAQQSHMQPPPITASTYHQVQNEQQFSQPQMQPNLQFRDDAAGRGYSLTHYPTG